MSSSPTSYLDWPSETARPLDDGAAELCVPGSNLVLDLHGDPTVAQLVVFSDGNHHMALADTLAAFLRAVPEAQDIFYATTPPRVVVEALKTGKLATGNLSLKVHPHVFIGPEEVLKGLESEGLVRSALPVMRSRGLAILVARDNPKGIKSATDLLGSDVVLAISNPVTEAASFGLYEAAMEALAAPARAASQDVRSYLRSDMVIKSAVIHHREIPQLIASGAADASLIYAHLALRYTRIFPDRFEMIEVDLSQLPDAARFCTIYHAALVGEGGAFGPAFLDYFSSEDAAKIYRSHGLDGFA